MANAPADVRARTEVAVAAETAAALLVDGLLRHDPMVVAGIARCIGVTVTELRDAWRRVSDRGYEPPRRRPTTMAPSSTRRPDMPSPRRTWADEPAEQICTKCKTSKPIEEFAYASGGRRQRQCKECRRLYRQKRYLSVEMQAELGHILRFVAAEDDACVGEECLECSKAIEAGQNVVIRARKFEHAKCLTDAGLLDHRDGDVGRKVKDKR